MHKQNDELTRQRDECIRQMQNVEREKNMNLPSLFSVLNSLESTVNCLKSKKLQRNVPTKFCGNVPYGVKKN